MPHFQIKEILALFPECKFVGNQNDVLTEVAALQHLSDQKKPNVISWINDKNALIFTKEISIGLLILSGQAFEKLKLLHCNFLISPNPRQTFQKLLSLKFSPKRNSSTEPTACIHPSAKIGNDCYIGNHVVIEENVRIGNNVDILHNTVIMKGTQIGNNVKIGCNTTVGNFGFGYEKDESGNYSAIEHIGNVNIEDHVEIGNNTAIDRAVIGSTWIKKNAKIDNLVHIAHGVEIGENSLIIACAMIAGSTKIGDNCWVAPSASVLNKLEIGANCTVGVGAVVLKNFLEKNIIVGNPATTIEEYKKWSEVKKRLINK